MLYLLNRITRLFQNQLPLMQFVSFHQYACNVFSGKLSELYSNLVSHLSFGNDFILSTQDTVGMLSCVDSNNNTIKEYTGKAIHFTHL